MVYKLSSGKLFGRVHWLTMHKVVAFVLKFLNCLVWCLINGLIDQGESNLSLCCLPLTSTTGFETGVSLHISLIKLWFSNTDDQLETKFKSNLLIITTITKKLVYYLQKIKGKTKWTILILPLLILSLYQFLFFATAIRDNHNQKIWTRYFKPHFRVFSHKVKTIVSFKKGFLHCKFILFHSLYPSCLIGS